MIKNIIFDIGNVLMRFDYKTYIKELLGDDEVIEKVNNAIWHSGYWNDLDRGEPTDKMFQLMLERESDYKEQITLAFENVGQCCHKTEYAIPWIKELKARGYQVLYLSNYAENTMKAGPEALDFLPYMDGGVFSCYERVIKPDPRIYQIITERYGLVPEECVFLDDFADNVEAARKHGFNAIQFEDYEQASRELNKLLSEVNSN